MTEILTRPTGRRAFMGGVGMGGAALALSGCAGYGGYGFSLVDAVQRLLYLSTDRAFARMLANNGFWDQQVAQLGLGGFLGTRGDVLSRILTSGLFKAQLQNAFGMVAYRGAERAAPIVTDTVRVIGIQNAIDLVRGGPTAATSYLRSSMGNRLVEAMVPELGTAMRVASDPLVGQLLSALTGVQVGEVTNRIAFNVNNTIWDQIGMEEADIRANPAQTNDPLITGVFGANARF